MSSWNNFNFDARERREKPDDTFFVGSVDAITLRRLSGVFRRTRHTDIRSIDEGIQRRHDFERSNEIARFVRYGYPYSTLSDGQRRSGRYSKLQKPGWLPGAIIVNVLKLGSTRRGEMLSENDIVRIDTQGPSAMLTLPQSYTEVWEPSGLAPLEIIDGQHRLFAFDEGDDDAANFDLPCIFFNGLDVSWQAYLFYTVNIKPKKISQSLAFDLYPLLRTEDWLNLTDNYSVYRETRAQEITESLWSHPESVWRHRINMLGDPGRKGVSQASFVRSLSSTLIKSFEGKGTSIGGLFGARRDGAEALPWTRSQQAAFVISAWGELATAISERTTGWAKAMRQGHDVATGDQALVGTTSLLNQDQGVRGFLQILNDYFVYYMFELSLSSWISDRVDADLVDEEVTQELRSLESQESIVTELRRLSQRLSEFDWRSSDAVDLSDEERLSRRVYRGAGGYKALRVILNAHLAASDDDRLSRAARYMVVNSRAI